MEERASNQKEVFLDTAFAIALSSPKDAHHELAVQISEQLEINQTRLITTRAVLIEVGNSLAKQAFREAAIELIESLAQDPSAEIVPISEQLYERAFELYRERRDKEWGLTDCISFVVMQEKGVIAALTPDKHFEQAGFQALMRLNS